MASNGSPRILVVDDEADINHALKVGLQQKGFQVDTQNDPTEALAEFRAGVYDIAILDMRMPKMDGFSLFRQIRKIDHNVHVCFFTAFDVYEKEFRNVFPDMRVDAFLKKPMTVTEIEARLKLILKDGQANGIDATLHSTSR